MTGWWVCNDKYKKYHAPFVNDHLPTELSRYQFIFLDSANKPDLQPQDLEQLQARNPGNFRDSNTFQHDVDIVIEIPKKGRSIQKSLFNQCGEMDIFGLYSVILNHYCPSKPELKWAETLTG